MKLFLVYLFTFFSISVYGIDWKSVYKCEKISVNRFSKAKNSWEKNDFTKVRKPFEVIIGTDSVIVKKDKRSPYRILKILESIADMGELAAIWECVDSNNRTCVIAFGLDASGKHKMSILYNEDTEYNYILD